MNKLMFIGLALFGAILLLSTSSKAEEVSNPAETVVDANGNRSRIAALEGNPLLNFAMRKAQCYSCTAPCREHSCCPGPYPQCCYIEQPDGPLCGCCSRP